MRTETMSPSKVHAVLLAAGTGSRLGSLNVLPKILLSLGTTTLLDFILLNLRNQGVRYVTLLVGYKKELVVEACQKWTDSFDELNFVENDTFEKTGHGWSLFLSREKLQRTKLPVLLIHGDTFFHPELLSRLLKLPTADLMVVSRGSSPATDRPRALLQNQKVTAVTVGAALENSGELIGMNLWSWPTIESFFKFLEGHYEHEDRGKNWEPLFGIFLQKNELGIPILETQHLSWANINRKEDLEFARTESAKILQEIGNEDLRRKKIGARLLSEANDLKRDPESLARELNLCLEEVRNILSGECSLEQQANFITAMEKTYPVDASQLLLPRDDTPEGVRLMTREQSLFSARTLLRRVQKTELEYYEYRDTACSSMGPFKPEWIKMLRSVSDSDPENPNLAWNKGHFLHQATMILGPVNYYWEINGKRFCKEMTTGDSIYGTPFWPHTFASRDSSQEAAILAVTFGGEVSRAQRELYTLGKGALPFALSSRTPGRAQKQLIQQWLGNLCLPEAIFQKRLTDLGGSFEFQQRIDADAPLNAEEVSLIATALGLQPHDLAIPDYLLEDEVIFEDQKRSETWQFPGLLKPDYRISALAHSLKSPLARGQKIQVLSEDRQKVEFFCVSSHTWIYNFGEAPIKIHWWHGDVLKEADFSPGDSVYLRPFIRHAFTKSSALEGQLCCYRIAGAMTLSAQREFSYLSDPQRALFESQRWY